MVVPVRIIPVSTAASIAQCYYSYLEKPLTLVGNLSDLPPRPHLIILPSFFAACAVTSVVLIAQPNMELFSPLVQGFGTASWSLDVIINTAVTCGIAYRLWRAGREIGHSGAYKSTIFTVIESGALIASCTIVIFSLDIAGSPAGFIAINVAAQIAVSFTVLLLLMRS